MPSELREPDWGCETLPHPVCQTSGARFLGPPPPARARDARVQDRRASAGNWQQHQTLRCEWNRKKMKFECNRLWLLKEPTCGVETPRAARAPTASRWKGLAHVSFELAQVVESYPEHIETPGREGFSVHITFEVALRLSYPESRIGAPSQPPSLDSKPSITVSRFSVAPVQAHVYRAASRHLHDSPRSSPQ